MLRMLDLFSGIGGFSYAGEKLVGGYETVAFCEYDKHAQKVLRKHWPDTEIIDDVRELANDADRFRGLVDIVVGGYPCQPFSLAGVRRGDKDDRHLWPEMLRIIQAVRPTWVIGENVAGHISMGLDEVLLDLEAEGYQARCFVIPAVAADARHRRDRCWIIAYADREGEPDGTINEQRLERAVMGNAKHDGSSAVRDIGRIQGEPDRQTQEIEQFEGSSSGASAMGNAEREQRGTAEARRLDVDRLVLDRSQGREETDKAKGSGADVSNASGEGLQGDVGEGQAGAQGQSEGYPAQCRWWEPEPAVGRVANGVSGRIHRLRQLGNSIVPPVAARILWAIKEAHNG
jgi:DNA (cytosine-5)-methyltransferase 1